MLSIVQFSSAASDGGMVVSANTPEVVVSTGNSGRDFLRLPELSYEFSVAAVCPAPLRAESLSLGIADTRASVPAASLRSGTSTHLSMTIPAAQIAPVVIGNLCVGSDAEEPTTANPVRIAAILSVQAALLCVGDSGSEMLYAAEPLDVLLHCEATAAGGLSRG